MNKPEKVVAYLGLGSNLGDKIANIKKALAALDDAPGVRVLRVAPYYRTAPVGYTKQDFFVNTAASIETILPPLDLLALLLDVEKALGRVRGIRWGPRHIDIDLLLYGKEEINRPELVVPHPRMHERAFVMVPLADLAPGMEIPGRGKVAGLALTLADQQYVALITDYA